MQKKLIVTEPQTHGMQVLLCILSLGAALAAHADSPYIWNGGGADNYWNNADNWGGNLPVPATTNSLQFQGTTRLTPENDFPASSAFRDITFNPGAGAFTLLGNSIVLASGITNNSGILQTLDLPLSVTSTRYVATMDGNLTLGGVISGGGGLHIVGSGKTTLTAPNTYDGYTYVNGGMLVLPEGAAINNAGNFIMGRLAGDNGAVYIQGGSVTNSQASSVYNFLVGRYGNGSADLTAGTVQANRVYIGYTGGYGTALIDGGSLYANGGDYMVLGYNSGTGVLTVKSGLVSHSSGTIVISLDNNSLGRGEINMLGGTLDNSGSAISFGLNTGLATVGTGSGIVNINGGNLLLNRFISASKNGTPQDYNSVAYVNFNGGTLVASASTLTSSLDFSSNFIPAYVNIFINGAFGEFPGGAIIDSAGQDCLAESPFLAPTGEGIRELKIADGGSGYIGAPYVSVSGDGKGATAIANMVDDGTGKGTFKVGSITVCNPGVDYTAIGTSFSLIGGGAPSPAVPDSTAPVVTAPNTSGGLTKSGLGTLTLMGTNTYTGDTVVNGGRLVLSTVHAGGGNVIVNDGGSFGALRDPVTPSMPLGSITTAAGGELAFILPAGNTSSEVVTVGTLNLNGATAIAVSGADFVLGQFPLIKYTTLVGDPALITNSILSAPDGVSGYIVHNAANSSFDFNATLISGALKWRGTISTAGVGIWDELITANWVNNGTPKVFIQGADVTFDDSAPGASIVSLVGDLAPGSLTVDNNGKNYTFGGTGSLSGATGLTKTGSGSLTMTNASFYDGATLVNGGSVTISGSLSNSAGAVSIDNGSLSISGSVNTGTGAWKAGANSGKGVINVLPGAEVLLANTFQPGYVAGDGGAVNISGGTLTNLQATASGNFEIGHSGYGAMRMSGGIVRANQLYVPGSYTGLGVATISGGEFYCGTGNDYLLVGSRDNTGSLTVTGGLLSHAYANRLISVNNNADGRGELNLLGGEIDNTGGGIGYGYNTGTGNGSGIVNINGGNLRLNRFVNKKAGTTGTTGISYLNLNGGTLTATLSTLTSPSQTFSSSFLPPLTAVYVNGPFGSFAGGAVIDTAGQDCLVEADLLAPTGEGVSALAVANGGSGYIGAPYVSIVGDGTGANAIANMVSDGAGGLQVGSVTVCNPGVNYTAGGTYFTFVGGSPAVAATPGAVSTAPNTSGGLTKNGPGILTLQGANTYAGATIVNDGALRVDGSLASAAVTVAGGALGGNGVVNGPVNVTSGMLAPAGTLTINNILTFAATGQALMSVNADTSGADLVQGITTANYDGTLILTNTAGTLTNGQTFQLFSAAAHSGTFATIQSTDGGATWSFDPATGVATVLSTMATTPTNISFTINPAGTELYLTWPGSHRGWLAQSNAVSLADAGQWFDIPGSDSVTNLVVEIDKSLGNVFYRLRKP